MGIMITIFVVIIIIIITIMALELRAGRSSVELYHILRSKPLATGRPTSNSHGSRPRPQGGRARGEPTPQGTTGGGYHGTMGWGGEGGA